MPTVLASDLSGYKDQQIQDLDTTLGNPFAPTPSSDSLTNPLGTGNGPSDTAPSSSSLPSPFAPVTAPLTPPLPAPSAPVTAPLVPPTSDATAPRQSQFAMGLSASDAMAFCGPAAAMALAAKYGNNIPVDVAKQAAIASGWDAANGMHGVGAEQALLNKMGVPTSLEGAVNWDHVTSAVQQGTPVIISTPGHYFVVDGVDSNTGVFHVGTSGTDLIGGNNWMSAKDMQDRMGNANGALYVQNPSQPTAADPTAPKSDLNSLIPDSSSRSAFIQSTLPLAQAWEAKTGIPAAYFLAVNGSESNWGKAPGNELFGIKAHPGNPDSINLNTWEQGQGATNDSFSAYKNANAAYADFVNLISTSPRYAPAWQQFQQDHNPAALFQNLNKAGYATDPDWGTKIAQSASSIEVPPGLPPEHIAAADQTLPNPFDAARAVADQVGQSKDAAITALDNQLGNPFQKAADTVGDAFNQLGTTLSSPNTLAQGQEDTARATTSAADTVANTVAPLQDIGAQQAADARREMDIIQQGANASPADHQWLQDQMSNSALAIAGVGDTSGAGEIGKVAQDALSMSRDDLAATLKQYPSDIQDGLRSFVQDQSKAGVSGKDINNTLRQWVADNPLSKVDEVPAIGADITPGKPVDTTTPTPPTTTAPDPNDTTGYRSLFQGGGKDLGNSLLRHELTQAEQKMADLRIKYPNATDEQVAQSPLGQQITRYRADAQARGLLDKDGNLIPEGSTLTPQPLTDNVPNGTVTSGDSAPTAPAQDATAAPPAAAQPANGPTVSAPVTQDQVAPQNPLQKVGSVVSSAFQPIENLPDGPVKDSLKRYAAVVGPQSQASQVLADTANKTLADTGVVYGAQGIPLTSRQGVVSNVEAKARADLNGVLQANRLSERTPEIAAILRNITNPSAIAKNPLGSAVLGVNSAVKGSLFGLSNMHNYTEALTTAVSAGPKATVDYARAFVSPNFYEGVRYGDMAPQFDKAAMDGVTGLHMGQGGSDVYKMANIATRSVIGAIGGAGTGYEESLRSGDSDNVVRNALIGAGVGATAGAVSPALFQSLFQRAVPLAKVTLYSKLVDGGMDGLQAAATVNRTFGGLNYAQMGRSQTLQDAMRLIMTAPDWNEATVRQLGSAVTGGTGGNFSRALLVKAVGGSMIASELLNLALTGHSTFDNEPGHQLQVQVGTDTKGQGVYMGFMPGNIQAYANLIDKIAGNPSNTGPDVGQFAMGRVGVIPQLAIDAGTGSEYPGGPKSKSAVASLASRAAPIGIDSSAQALERGTAAGAVLASLLAGPNLAYGSTKSGAGVPARTGRPNVRTAQRPRPSVRKP